MTQTQRDPGAGGAEVSENVVLGRNISEFAPPEGKVKSNGVADPLGGLGLRVYSRSFGTLTPAQFQALVNAPCRDPLGAHAKARKRPRP